MEKIILLSALTLCLLIGTCAAAEDTSFVDYTVYGDSLFEEDPADEFLAEKREINRLYASEKFPSDDATVELLNAKIDELEEKEFAKYGDNYVDLDSRSAIAKLMIVDFDVRFTYSLQNKLADYGTDLAERLKDENLWKAIETTVHKEFEDTGIPPEVNFRLDQKFAEMCKTVLGDDDLVTLRHTINLIHDYSLLGDSKTALTMAKKILPTVKKTFGNNSREVAELLAFMADDYATLGDYGNSEDTLLKAIDVNLALHGNESSPELVANLVALAKLNRGAPATMKALDEAAKNFSEDELYKLGYFRAKLLTNPNNDRNSNLDFMDVNERELDLADEQSRDYFNKWIDMLLVESENIRTQGHYFFSWDVDLLLLNMCKVNLGNYHHKTLRALCNLSDDYLAINQAEEALTLAEYALDMSREIYGEHPCTIRATHNLTNVYRKMGRYEEAWANDYAAFEISKKFSANRPTVELAEYLTNLADLAADAEGLQKNSSAIKFYENFLELAELDENRDAKVADVRKNLARLYNLSGDYAKTVALYDFLRKDNFYSLDDLNVGGLIAAHTADALAEALSAVDKKSAAAEVYSQAEEKFEEVRLFNSYSTNENQRELFAQTVPYYKKAAAFFVSQGNNINAFRRIELCKGRTLADQYGELLAMYKSGVTDTEIKTLNDYRNKIYDFRDKFSKEYTHGSTALKINLINTRMNTLRNYNNFRDQLREKYPQYEELAEGSWIMTYQVVKDLSDNNAAKLVPPNHCYISFAVAEDKILAFVADDSGKVKSFAIAVDENFADNCRAYHALLEQDSIGNSKFLWRLSDGNYKITLERDDTSTADADFIFLPEDLKVARQKLSAQLGETLLEPLASSIAAQTWIISPDGDLNTIPFETLTLNGEMVIKSKNICYVPSLAVLQLMRDAGEKNSRLAERKELLAMGNAVYQVQGGKNLRGASEISRMHEPLINLPGTAKEIDKVSSHFRKNFQAVMTGRDASERNLKQLDTSGNLGQYKYLLFAAHGLFIPEKPELSSIVLSQGLNDADFDGYVTVGEWLGYKLNSDLIYLSACESGRGDYQEGEGIVGIPYALTMAGNKDTVMSLWKVRDTPTAEFSAAVFEKLSRGQSEIQALNETKREFLSSDDAELNDPTVWAAFVLYGI